MAPSRLKNWREVIFEDWPNVEVTQATVRRAIEYRGQVRKPYKPEEYESRRAKILNRPPL